MKISNLLIIPGIIALAICFVSIKADTDYQLEFKRVHKISKNEVHIYPAKEKVDGILWGTNDEYTPGMTFIKVLCNAGTTLYTRNADGDKERISVYPFRLEAWRMNDAEEWEFSTWYRFSGHQSYQSCQAMMTTAMLLNNKNRLILNFKIKDSGAGHRSLLDSWKIQEP